MMGHVAGWFLLFAAGAIIAVGVYFLERTSRQNTWREGRARITRSAVVFEWEYYRADIRYEYVVAGSSLDGDKVRSGLLQYNWSGPAKRLCAKYPVGSEHAVFFDEADPTQAVL